MYESGEMYLETILILSNTKEYVRSIDIVEKMNFSKPSVSRAVGKLKEDGFIDVSGNGHITLTETGKVVAERIYERHTVLTMLLKSLGVDAKTAENDACKIEHDISDESFTAMKNHLNKHNLL